MPRPPVDAVRITPIGLDQRQCNALRMVFEGACRNAYCFAETAPPQAWIVDLDHLGAADTLVEQQLLHGNHPTLFLSVIERDSLLIGGAAIQGVFLRKPFRVDDFVRSLAVLTGALRAVNTPPLSALQIAATPRHQVDAGHIAATSQGSRRAARLLDDETTHALVGTAPDVDLSGPGPREQIYYDPEHFLQGRVTRAWRLAKEAARPLRVAGPWPAITLFPAENKVQLAAPARHFRPFASLADLPADPQEALLDATLPPGGDSMSFDAFLWKLTLWAARGRLPRGTPLDSPIYLRYWPNFSRLDVIPWSLASAALWSREPHTLARSVQVLGAPQRFVFAFYSAAHALGLADVSRRAVDSMFEPQALPAESKQKGILGRILDKLRIAS